MGDLHHTARTSSIGSLHAQNKDKSCIVWASKIVRDQPPDFLIHWSEAKRKGATNIGNQEDNDEEATSVLEAVIEEDTDKDTDGDKDSVRYLGRVGQQSPIYARG